MQIRIMNQRKVGRKAESGLLEGQLTLFDSFNEVEATSDDKAPYPEISEVSFSAKESVYAPKEYLNTPSKNLFSSHASKTLLPTLSTK